MFAFLADIIPPPDFGYTPLQTSTHFLPLGITALILNFLIPHLITRLRPLPLILLSWALAATGIILLALLRSNADYYRYCLPGMILYITGVGTVYYVGNVVVVGSAKPEDQGSVSGVYNMCLNVGGAVLGVAVVTVVANSVTDGKGGVGKAGARLKGYRAGYWACVGMCGVAGMVSVWGMRVGKGQDGGEGGEGSDVEVGEQLEGVGRDVKEGGS